MRAKRRSENDERTTRDRSALLLSFLRIMSVSVDNTTRLTMPLAIELCKHHPYYAVGDTIWRIGTLLCILLGMPGHILVVTIMLNARNRRQPVCLYFATIAVFEFAYLSSRFIRKFSYAALTSRKDLSRERTEVSSFSIAYRSGHPMT